MSTNKPNGSDQTLYLVSSTNPRWLSFKTQLLTSCITSTSQRQSLSHTYISKITSISTHCIHRHPTLCSCLLCGMPSMGTQHQLLILQPTSTGTRHHAAPSYLQALGISSWLCGNAVWLRPCLPSCVSESCAPVCRHPSLKVLLRGSPSSLSR